MSHESRKTGWLIPFTMAFIVIMAMIAFVQYAQAQTTGQGFFGGFRDPLLEVASVVIAAFLAWLTTWLRTLFNMQVEEKDRQALQSALEHAAQLVIDRALRTQQRHQADLTAEGSGVVAKEALKEIGLDISQTAINVGIGYVKQSVPDAVKRFGLDDLFINKLLRPHLSKVLTSLTK